MEILHPCASLKKNWKKKNYPQILIFSKGICEDYLNFFNQAAHFSIIASIYETKEKSYYQDSFTILSK